MSDDNVYAENMWHALKEARADLETAIAALAAIDRHVVGACAECGEMREIAAQALAAMKKAEGRTKP